MEKSYKMQQTLFEILPPLQVIAKVPLFTRPLMLCMSVGQEIAIDVLMENFLAKLSNSDAMIIFAQF